MMNAGMKVFRIIPEFRILRLTFYSKYLFRQIVLTSLIYVQSV